MRIGIDARFYRKETGGFGRYTRGLLTELAKIDKKNEYVLFMTGKDVKEYEDLGERFKVVKTDIVHYSVEEQKSFGRLVDSCKLDLIHYLSFNHPIFCRTPFVVTIHDLTMTLFPVGRKQKNPIRKWAYNYIMKRAAQKSRKVLVPSMVSKNDVVSMLGADRDKVVVTYEGVDDTYAWKTNEKIRKEIKEQYGIKKPYLLFVSQLRPHKGVIPLVGAYEILRKKYEDDVELVLAGKINQDFPEIVEAIEKTRSSVGGVITPGFVAEEDLPALYAAAEIFVFPSWYEGFGIPPLEAMAAGTPVASSNASCMPEILQDAAVYFDPKDRHDIARVADGLLNDKNRQAELVALGREQLKKFSWRKMAEETLAVYEGRDLPSEDV